MSTITLQSWLPQPQTPGSEGGAQITADELHRAYLIAVSGESGPAFQITASEATALAAVRGQYAASARLMARWLQPQVDAIAHRSRVGQGGPGTGLARILPRPFQRDARELQRVSAWMRDQMEYGTASAARSVSTKVRVVPANFAILSPAQQAFSSARPPFSIDGVVRRFWSGDPGIMTISRRPVDGILDMTLVMHPSGHRPRGSPQTLNYHNFARRNLYNVRVIYPDGQSIRLRGIRDRPLGPNLPGLRGMVADGTGNEEYVTTLDLSIDMRGLRTGQEIRVEMWPDGTGIGGRLEQRVFLIRVPPASTPIYAGGAPPR